MENKYSMSTLAISAPEPSEYAPYFGRYISLIGENDIITSLTRQVGTTLSYLRSLPETRGEFRYAPDKWSVKEVLAHVIDSERVFAYRALSFARNDAALLPGFEQDDWMKASAFDAVPLRELIDEFEHLRLTNILFFKHLPNDAWMRRGVASGNPFTVRSIAYIIAGHELHHLDILQKSYR